METRNNVYQMVADKIVEQLEKGVIAWCKPWRRVAGASSTGLFGGAINYCSRKEYSLLNQMLLMKEGEWLSFKQIQDLGGRIKKGEKASFVVFFKQLVLEDEKEQETQQENEGQEKVVRTIPILRYYNVWHIDQTEGIESKTQVTEPEQTQPEPEAQPELETIAEAERIIAAYVERAALKFQNDKPSNEAYYSPVTDEVVVPMRQQYEEIAEYYSTTFHELTHSTGAAKRLNRREGMRGMNGNDAYSREELVAEMGAAMLCNVTGVDCETAFDNSVAYIKGWSRKIKNDPKMFVIAAGQAEKAARYIMGETIERAN